MKKFVNLPQNYKNLLNDIKINLNKEIVKSIANKSISYKNLLVTYNKINQLCINNNCNSYDLNRLISYYDKQNNIIDIIKCIATLKNKYIVYYAQKSQLWKLNLIDLKNNFKKQTNKNINIDQVEKGFIKILKKYKYDWDGLWSIIDISKKGEIKNINLFDLDDLDEILINLNR